MVGEVIQAIVHRLNRNRGTPPEPGDADYIAPGDPGYVQPPAEGEPGYVKPIPYFIGEQFVNQQDSPPRLVWVPTTDSFGAPSRIGTNPRALRSRAAGLECAVWGPIEPPDEPSPAADFEGTEELLRQLVVAMHQELRARFKEDPAELLELGGAEWLTPGQITSYGMVVILRHSIRVPVSVDPLPTGKAETLTMNVSITQ